METKMEVLLGSAKREFDGEEDPGVSEKKGSKKLFVAIKYKTKFCGNFVN